MAVDHMPEQVNAISGLMVTAIVGGAVVPPIMGLVADKFRSMQVAFLVPLIAILYITATALANRGTKATKTDPAAV